MIRKLSALLVLGALWAPAAQAQEAELKDGDKPKTELELKLDKKLATPFTKKVAWFTDLAKAKQAAKRENKVIFIYFTRSYAP